MAYERLQEKGLIKSFEAAPSQISDRLALARRDIEAAKSPLSTDGAYCTAYNAMLQAGRALMFAEGYRPARGEGQHKAVVQFTEIALGQSFKDEIRFFEKMRVKRNRSIHDTPGIVSETEARQAIDFALRFIYIIDERIHNPTRKALQPGK